MSKIVKRRIKKEHRINLIKLMLSVTKSVRGTEFDMQRIICQPMTYSLHKPHYKTYSYIDMASGKAEPPSGTRCCPIGHALLSGIGNPVKFDNGFGGIDWDRYTKYAFGIHFDLTPYNFLFGIWWPNVRAQAAARIQYYLLGGCIREFKYSDQYEDLDRTYWKKELNMLEGK